MEKMYHDNREIVLVENKHENNLDNILCHGCVLDNENFCSRAISPPQSNNVCCPNHTGKYYIFKFKEKL